MEPGRKGHVKSSPLYDVDLKKTDTYTSVISKIYATIGIEETEDMKLFNAKGSIIPDQPIALRAKEVNWTLGSFLLKRHTSAEKVSLGVGSVEGASTKEGRKRTESMESFILMLEEFYCHFCRSCKSYWWTMCF